MLKSHLRGQIIVWVNHSFPVGMNLNLVLLQLTWEERAYDFLIYSLKSWTEWGLWFPYKRILLILLLWRWHNIHHFILLPPRLLLLNNIIYKTILWSTSASISKQLLNLSATSLFVFYVGISLYQVNFEVFYLFITYCFLCLFIVIVYIWNDFLFFHIQLIQEITHHIRAPHYALTFLQLRWYNLYILPTINRHSPIANDQPILYCTICNWPPATSLLLIGLCVYLVWSGDDGEGLEEGIGYRSGLGVLGLFYRFHHILYFISF